MGNSGTTSDQQLVDLLARRGPTGVAEMGRATGVTATAVRQRLARLMCAGLIERIAVRSGRGRPSHRYTVTEKARRQAGTNFADLALVLWNEVRAIESPEVRRGLLKRLASAMAQMYGDRVAGDSLESRMGSLQELMGERRVGVELRPAGQERSPTLQIVDCPYPELAERDRGICAVENMLFSELLNTPMRLSQCRLDGHACCQFETR
ncbi:MAG TPA: AsnC family transcriptional regulator [Pirellulales bacterium]|jgi:predicted ArsR family transcriptional regulator|nr:AsnC family transcriptional regulator [Pirellulales bacterium]